jgi:hypothetical protein
LEIDVDGSWANTGRPECSHDLPLRWKPTPPSATS